MWSGGGEEAITARFLAPIPAVVVVPPLRVGSSHVEFFGVLFVECIVLRSCRLPISRTKIAAAFPGDGGN